MDEPPLGVLFNQYGTDKDKNGYTAIYEPLLKPLRHKPIHLLEVGIGTMNPDATSTMFGYALEGYKPGGSLRAWREYFRRGSIVGIDCEPDSQFKESRITTYLADSLQKGQIDSVLKSQQFHVIIDDASHYDESQFQTLKNCWNYLQPGGYYFIENIPYWSRIPTEFREKIAEFVGPLSTLYYTEHKNMLVITKGNPTRHKTSGTRKNGLGGPLRARTRSAKGC